ncbi:MAG: RibD family protein [Burkholderiaceae bacterium]
MADTLTENPAGADRPPARGSAARNESLAWQICLALTRARGRRRFEHGGYRLDGNGGLQPTARIRAEHDEDALLRLDEHGWHRCGSWTAQAQALFDLYLGLGGGADGRARVVGHLGQSIDGHIATHSGDARYVSAQQDLVHLHRMRALCDAVIVGAATVAADDPRLTTRLVLGEHPVRVIIDPTLRLPRTHRVFNDGEAPTLVACDPVHADPARAPVPREQLLCVPSRDGVLDLRALIEQLQARGLALLFVEGGGRTVSRFIEAGCLDRLQIAVAPLIIGDGRRGLTLPGAAAISDCARPPYRLFRLGNDVLWDFDLRAARGVTGQAGDDEPGLQRLD